MALLTLDDYTLIGEALEPLTLEYPYAVARRHEGERLSQKEWLRGIFASSALAAYYGDLDPGDLDKALSRAYRTIH